MNSVWAPDLPTIAMPQPVLRSDISGSAYCNHQASELNGDALTGDISTAMLGQIRICRIRAQPHIRQLLHPIESYVSAPFLKIVSQRKGRAYIQQKERRTILAGGQWSIYDASRPYAVQNVEELEQLSIMIPRDIKAPEIELGINLVPEESMALGGMISVLFNAAQTAFDEADEMDQPTREALGDELLELAKLALFNRLGGAARISMRDTFREKVKRYVTQNLADSDLNISSIAEALQCSKRYLHKGFAESGMTLSQFIWAERLERTRRDLLSTSLSNRSITEIAFNWGFVNSAHFSRRFQKQYGVCPREYRRRMMD